jgi:hypothetical protein
MLQESFVMDIEGDAAEINDPIKAGYVSDMQVAAQARCGLTFP